LIKTRQNSGSGYYLSFSNQEDIHEGLTLILDSIGEGVDKLFHTRYQCEIKCLGCKKITHPGEKGYEEPPEIVIDLMVENLRFKKKPLITKKRIEKHIGRIIQAPRDYKCDCGKKNIYDVEAGVIENNIIQVYSLVRISEVIILLFKKYEKNKRQIYFPP